MYRISDGDDPDWASWYADWLVNHSELPDLLDVAPVRSELVYMLVRLDKKYTMESPHEKFEDYYARGLLEHFRTGLSGSTLPPAGRSCPSYEWSWSRAASRATGS